MQMLFDNGGQIVLLIVVAENDLTKNRQGPGIKLPDPCALMLLECAIRLCSPLGMPSGASLERLTEQARKKRTSWRMTSVRR